MSDAFDGQTVDVVSLSQDGTLVRLYIAQAGEWTGSDEQLVSLQEKVNSYLTFILDGQMGREYPQAAGRSWEIVIHCQTGPPDARTREFLELARRGVQEYGGDLVTKID
ncbi:MAG: hypothetical protein JO367_10130 [Actinobacteria bacterium]|nr:hypothetical protein [Actinomycetota bacterium]